MCTGNFGNISTSQNTRGEGQLPGMRSRTARSHGDLNGMERRASILDNQEVGGNCAERYDSMCNLELTLWQKRLYQRDAEAMLENELGGFCSRVGKMIRPRILRPWG